MAKIGIENLSMKFYTAWDLNASIDKEMFMIEDLFGLLTDLNLQKTKVLLIQNYNGTQEEKEKAIKYIVSLFENRKDVVIISWAYVSTKEFPENEYYNPHEGFEASTGSELKPIPFDEIIERESKLLETCGFENFNKLTQYEFSEVYLYTGNELGRKLVDYINKGVK